MLDNEFYEWISKQKFLFEPPNELIDFWKEIWNAAVHTSNEEKSKQWFEKHIGIFGSTYEIGWAFLNGLSQSFSKKDILRIVKMAGRFSIEMNDGTIYQVIHATEASRGNRFGKVYVDSRINRDIINTVIRPSVWIFDKKEEDCIIYF